MEVELVSVAGEFDDQLQWPLHCTLSLQLLDWHGERHLERRKVIRSNVHSLADEDNAIVISYYDIQNPRNGPQYLKDDCLHFRVDVKPKYK